MENQKKSHERLLLGNFLRYYNSERARDFVEDPAGETDKVDRNSPRCDFICRDSQSGEEIAVEITTMYDDLGFISRNPPELYWKIKEQLEGKLPGSFRVFVRRRLKEGDLVGKIQEKASKLQVGEVCLLWEDGAEPISREDFSNWDSERIEKTSNCGSSVEFGFPASEGRNISQDRIEVLDNMLKDMNAKFRIDREEGRTCISLIEDRALFSGPREIELALKELPASYTESIDQIFLISGNVVEEVQIG